MPRYYFDVRCPQDFHRDEIGDEFADFEEARRQAQSLLPHIVHERCLDGGPQIVTCDVRDEVGRIVYRGEITFRGTQDPR